MLGHPHTVVVVVVHLRKVALVSGHPRTVVVVGAPLSKVDLKTVHTCTVGDITVPLSKVYLKVVRFCTVVAIVIHHPRRNWSIGKYQKVLGDTANAVGFGSDGRK